MPWCVGTLVDRKSEQSSPFRRWTLGSGAGSYRSDHRGAYNKQISESPTSSPASPAVGSCRAPTASWSMCLEKVLRDPAACAAYYTFLDKEFAAENLKFWLQCDKYSRLPDSERREMADNIYATYMTDVVNLDAATKRSVEQRLNENPPPADLFIEAQSHVFNIMKFDSYLRFLKSDIHAEYVRAELRGETKNFVDPSTSKTDQSPHSSKLKKSASNASERRRSGGSTLLSWKLRTASRDRAHPNEVTNEATKSTTKDAPRSNIAKTFPIKDVVRNSQAEEGQCTLCRVVLPDGATSVVGVDENVTVRDLVERLMTRRNLLCNAYDVIYKDCEQAQGEPAAIDCSLPSTILGGREVVIERRCVVRIEIGGRCVAVRCRPARRLRHVLRPVMVRYGAATSSPHRAVMKDGRLIHPDTSMQELDGARLQIIDVVGAGDCPRPDARQRDDDSDNMSEEAVKLQEDIKDDELIAVTSVNSSRAPEPVAGPSGLSSVPGARSVPGPRIHPGITIPIPSSCTTRLTAEPSPIEAFGAPPQPRLGGVPCPLPLPNSRGMMLGPSFSEPIPGPSSRPDFPVPDGRVRAALRPGPPLHHHPPEFLDNLREIQRVRLTKNDPTPPRTPPPLPPKPPQRSATTQI